MSGFFRLIGMVAVLCITPVTGIQFSMTRNQVELGNPSGTDNVLTMTCTTDVDVLLFKIIRETVDGGAWQPIASFSSKGGSIATGLPSYWTLANITGNVNDQKSLTISVQASSLTCDDDRTYQCEVTYLNDQTLKTETEVLNSTLRITAAPSPPTLTARNWNTNTPINTGFNQDTPASMAVGEQVELTCVANIGSDSSRTIRWQKSSEVNAGQMIDYTTNKDDGIAVQNSGSNHCTYSRTSTIRYNTTVVDSNRNEQMGLRFSCFFQVNQQDTQQMFYIQVAGGSVNPDASVDNAGTSSAGVIAGSVVGALVVIVIIALLVYFLWYRKRSTGNDYKTKEEYGSENPNMAPAPSDLYATPNKPKHRRGHENRGLDEPHESNSRRHDDYNGRGRANFGMRGDDDEFDHYDSRDGSPTLTDKGISHMGVDPVNLSIGTGV